MPLMRLLIQNYFLTRIVVPFPRGFMLTNFPWNSALNRKQNNNILLLYCFPFGSFNFLYIIPWISICSFVEVAKRAHLPALLHWANDVFIVFFFLLLFSVQFRNGSFAFFENSSEKTMSFCLCFCFWSGLFFKESTKR